MRTCKIYTPHPLLQPYIRLFHVFESKKGPDDEGFLRVTPEGSFEFNLSLNGPLTRKEADGTTRVQPDHYVLDRFSRHYFMHSSNDVCIVGATFHPWGLRDFARVPSSEINGLVTLEELFGNKVHELQERILNSRNSDNAVKIIESYFLRQLPGIAEPDRIVSDAASRIFRSHGSIGMNNLVSRYDISHRRLEQRFCDVIGVSPKFYARLVRFKHALRRISSASDLNLTDISIDCGYYDQSHFIRDFKSFTGTSPKRYLRENRELNDLIMRFATLNNSF